MGININLRGREPNGIVEPGDEYERLRDDIIRELYRLKDPHTLNNVIDEVYRGEEIFFGEYSRFASDIIFVPHQYEYILRPTKRTNKHCISHANDIYPIFSGPDPNGIFIASGPTIRKEPDHFVQKYMISRPPFSICCAFRFPKTWMGMCYST